MTRAGMAPLKPFTGLLAGRHLYEEPGADPQLVDVSYVDGVPQVTFLDAEEEDQGESYDAPCMAGKFTKVLLRHA